MPSSCSFSKEERLSSKVGISVLMAKGKWGFCGPLKFCCLTNSGADKTRILVSVPKKFFKRAVKRNLLKRRIRESYRLQKDLLKTAAPVDIMFLYNTAELLPFSDIKAAVADILKQVSGWKN